MNDPSSTPNTHIITVVKSKDLGVIETWTWILFLQCPSWGTLGISPYLQNGVNGPAARIKWGRCVKPVTCSKSLTQLSMLVCCDRRGGFCLVVSGKNCTFVNCRQPTILFLGQSVQFCWSLQKSTLIVLFSTRWGPPDSLAVHGGGWAASGRDSPKLISDRASRKLSDQVTRHGGKAYTCLNVKNPSDKYIWVYAIIFSPRSRKWKIEC